MIDINDLRRKRADISEKVEALAVLEKDGAELSDDQVNEFYSLSQEFDVISAQIDRAETSEKISAIAAKPLKLGSVAETNTVNLPEHKGAKVARMVQAIGSTNGGGREAAHYAETVIGDADVAMALNTGTESKGGFLVPKAFSGELIELLYPMSVVRSSGAVVLPMPNGNLTMPKMVGGAMSSYMGENTDITASEQEFGSLALSAKKLATLVPMSNELLNYNGLNGNIEAMIVGDMTTSIALREDLAFMRGDGSGDTPTGLRNLATAATHVITASDGTTVQKVKTDLGKLKLAMMNANCRMINPGWLLNPTVSVFLSNLLDGNGNKVFPEMAMGTLDGYPYKVTTQLPFNLGAGTESEIALVDFANAIIGEGDDVRISVSTEASYKDPATGEYVSAFSRDQTLIRVITANDFGMRHDASNAWLTGITWGQ